ncbi:unnamed protein product [Adineta ricciae]|uniref:Uncharacterized protein n=1 Tax=Adineta ricciae TaxID=249248 RepID=A0A814TEE3_ADIRI|nr:unnamed protein product [Adineta ricciae]CAF1536214.1 unnamed protein product [Adineta ricciae]
MWISTFYFGSIIIAGAVCFKIGFIDNTGFKPLDNDITTMNMNGSCNECGCYAKEMNYSGFNCFLYANACLLFEAFTMNYSLNTMTGTRFYFFELPTVYQLISKKDVIEGIWNATAGGDSLNVTKGQSNGQYPTSSEGPASVGDYDLSTKYNNYGNSNYTKSLSNVGAGTGFYVTLTVGACVVTGIQFATANDAPGRDPITMTLEGSNITDTSLLSTGSSWTLIYSGSTGISNITIPPRSTYVDVQNFTNVHRFKSYRFIMTTQRGVATNLQYSEAHLLGYV